MFLCVSSRVKDASFQLKLAGLKDHAKYELEKAGLFDKDADYLGAIGKSVQELCDCFAGQGHSGYSADVTLELFDTLAKFHTLTPITSDKKEWDDVSEMSGEPLWQNKRDPSFFSKDGGKSWYVV
jgi:hypothetical protein